MPYTIKIPNTSKELNSLWSRHKSAIIPWSIVVGLLLFILWPRNNSAELQRLQAEKKALQQSVTLSKDSIAKINIQLQYAETHRDTINNRLIKYETSYYPVGPTPVLYDSIIAAYLARHGNRETFRNYRVDTTR